MEEPKVSYSINDDQIEENDGENAYSGDFGRKESPYRKGSYEQEVFKGQQKDIPPTPF